MPTTDISSLTTTNLTDTVKDYSVPHVSTDAATGAEETEYMITKWTQWFGYYKKIPELKKAIDAYATWVLGKGWDADPETQIILEHITGWGEDTINSIFWNLLVCKKVAGDAFAEIMKDEESGTIINLKVLDPGSIKIIADENGIIKRYEQMNKVKNVTKKFEPDEILHLCNDRVADEIHGVPVPECVQWVIDARNEAMTDWRRISHRSTIRVLYIDIDNQTKIDDVKRNYAEAIKKGELLILPVKKADAEFAEMTLPPIDAFLGWIKYLENFFYQAVGIPKVILGGSEEFTESSSKVAYLTYEQIYTREVVELEADLWNKLALRVTFRKPASLKNEMLQSEEKNTGQTGFQPNELNPASTP